MKKRTVKIACILLALVLTMGLLAACGTTAVSTSPESSAESTQSTVQESSVPVQEESSVPEIVSAEEPEETVDRSALPDSYPMLSEDGSATLSLHWIFMPMMYGIAESYGELPFWQELSRRTGVNLEWNMASVFTGAQQLELLIAANDLPNIVSVGTDYSKGITSAIEEDTFVNIAPYLEEYAPDYYQLIQEPDIYPAVSDMDGNMIGFYEILGEQFPPNNGVVIRGDLLEGLGAEAPVTYDEYETLMLQMKETYGIESPIAHFVNNYQWLSSGKNVSDDFSLNAEGACIYGPVENGFREYLITMNSWYEKGFFIKDFYSFPESSGGDVWKEYLGSGESVIAGINCNDIGEINFIEEGAYLVPGHLPRDKATDVLHLTDGTTAHVSMSTMCALGPNSTEEEVQLSCMLLNYLYSEEGSVFLNYGTENVSFEYQEDGTPWYTDLVLNNPDGLTQMQALISYVGYYSPGKADATKYNLSAVTLYADYVEVWKETDNAYAMPPVSLTLEEQETVNRVNGDITTYLAEAVVKFYIGDFDPNDDAAWQEYLDTLDKLGVQSMIDAYQAAYARFIAA